MCFCCSWPSTESFLFIILVSDCASVCHFQALKPLFYHFIMFCWLFGWFVVVCLLLLLVILVFCFVLCSCFILPASRHHLSLSALSLAHFQSFIFIPQCPCWWPICSFSCRYFCPQCLPSACGSDSTGQWNALLFCMQFIPQITIVCATTCLSSCVWASALPLFQSVVLLKDKRPQKYIGFPFAVTWSTHYDFQACLHLSFF